MSKIPQSIRIGAVDYKVVPVKEIDDGATMGEFVRDEKLIRIVTMSPQIDANTLFHEVLHGCYTCASLDATKTGARLEEPVVSGLTNQLMAVFRDNPKLLTYLSKAVRGK